MHTLFPWSFVYLPHLCRKSKTFQLRSSHQSQNLDIERDHKCFLDEKWFFISEKELLMYLTEGEEPPDRFCKHKSHILKVMFLCAVARPRFDEEGNEIFDGKIGI